jgi:hypothetical protein
VIAIAIVPLACVKFLSRFVLEKPPPSAHVTALQSGRGRGAAL